MLILINAKYLTNNHNNDGAEVEKMEDLQTLLDSDILYFLCFL